MTFMSTSRFCLAVLALLASACNEDREIKVYRVVNPPAPSTSPAADPHAGIPGMTAGVNPSAGPSSDPHAGLSAGQMAAIQSGPVSQVSDSPPAGWKKQAPTSMRQLSYLVEGQDGTQADVSLVILRGAAGGTLANVNLWRAQFGHPAVDEAGLKASSQQVPTRAGNAVAVDLEGLAGGADPKKDGRMIGAISVRGGDGWFFKMKGNSALVGAEKERFLQWVATVQEAAAPQPPANATAVPPGSTPPLAPPPSGAPSAPPSGPLTWELPQGWTQAPATSSMRYATFTVASADGSKGEISITHFPGDVGGDLDNVNRWRQQVSLPPIDAAGLAAVITPIAAGPKEIKFADFTGPQARLAAGWTRHGPETWFVKFTGPDALIASEKANFTQFLASLRFQSPE